MFEFFEQLIVSHSVWGIFASFIAGVVASFSPCIYPLIPVTLGIMGAYSIRSKKKAFLASFIFVLGIAIVYTLLGIISASFGVFLGVNPVSYIVIGLVLLILGLSMWKLIKIPFMRISFLCEKKQSLLVTGMIAGLAGIPCIFPIMGTILSMISLQKNIIYGGCALFSFSIGYGLLLMILGTCASLISKLPKSGIWLIIIERCIGGLLIFSGSYFLVKAVQLL